MLVEFYKMQALGNDFMVINSEQFPLAWTVSRIQQLADRHTGIGFDQLLLVGPHAKQDGDFHYRIFNADGKEVQQCANGARCAAEFIVQTGLSERAPMRLIMQEMSLPLQPLGEKTWQVDLPAPKFAAEDIPVLLDELPVDLPQQPYGWVNLGNPHFVVLRQLSRQALHEMGRIYNAHPAFPRGINVTFVRQHTAHHLAIATYERGVGLTLSCGSAACAAAIIGIEQGWVNSPVRIELPKGELRVAWQTSGEISLIGPAAVVYQGKVDVA